MASDRQQILNAIAKYGASVDHIASRYTDPLTGRKLSGRALLAKLLQGESSALSDPEKAAVAVSSAGARKWGQFMPGSRQEAISKFGIDPWASPDQAVHATALHLRGKINGSSGLEGYNPGDPNYPKYILEQKVGHLAGEVLRGGGGGVQAGAAAGGAMLASAVAPRVSGLDVAAASQPLALKAKPVPVASGAVPLPSFAAGPTFAPGYAGVQTSGGPSAPSALELPEPTQTALPEVVAPAPADGQGVVAGARAPDQAQGLTGARGKVVVAPGAERDGHGLQKGVLGFLRDVSATSGRDVTVTTGTNHNQFVVGTTRESDHWTGNAADLGVGGDARESKGAGKKGDLIAAHAIQVASQRAGDGMTFAAALKLAKKGGVFNFDTPQGRIQVLWRTLVGGNHYDHVHAGLRPA